jgi:hypothetical protein
MNHRIDWWGCSMGKLKKAFVIYLVVSSVILHVLAVWAIVFFAPAMKTAYEWVDDIGRASAGHPDNVGIIRDISTMTDGDYSYVGYAVEYKGQTHYVMGGAATEGIAKGDQVAV